MKVKIIERMSKFDLENEINDFLRETNDSDIIDIKYSGSGNHPTYSTDYYSAMIIMKR